MDRDDLVSRIVLTVMLAIGAGILTLEFFGMLRETAPCEAPEATGWEPPKLQLCPKDMELWDCIRDAKYRSDI